VTISPEILNRAGSIFERWLAVNNPFLLIKLRKKSIIAVRIE